MEISKALQVNVEDQSEDSDEDEEERCAASVSRTQSVNKDFSGVRIGKVQMDTSPFFFAFYKSHPVHVVVDTGDTSSLISLAFLKRAGINFKATSHSARAVDKTPLHISGEIKVTLQFGDIDLPITALVVEKLDCDILAGVPFCKENYITVHLKR